MRIVWKLIIAFPWLRMRWSWGSLVTIVSEYGQGRTGDRVRFPAEARDFFSSVSVQTRSEAHPVSRPMGSGGSLLGGKARLGRADN
jgi:hypothetical protein